MKKARRTRLGGSTPMEYEIFITNQVGLATSPDLAPDRSADPIKREPMKLRTIALVSAALLASLLLAGCSNSNSVGDMPTGETSPDAVIAPFNDADSEFAMNMIVHHTQAIEMAQFEIEDGENTDAIALAEKIVSDQASEIALMKELLATL